ncbi:MtnX-like HAD-IB family phosphatase [Desulfitobacterium chlororespirans]|uniref:MtnX-like HAD-IB family phosphatase n=1 Tax=Desulfitobacterium chlororespirans TaxID=51616 RepID=UPI000933685A|nr:MtnX-like HAD-IB family phosphatase [Desulfitobacterium chlororespirans]
MAELNTIFFVDFDGTIVTQDMCALLVETLAGEGWRELNEGWERKELSTLECARRTFKLFNSNDPEVFRQLIDQAVFDPRFSDFAAFCERRGFSLIILSDGYDFYIEYLLQREGLSLPYYANKLLFAPQLDVETPYSSGECELCGVCKLQLMEKLLKPGYRSVYIGDGTSDFCPAERADKVFAKSRLYQHCQEVGKEAQLFESFQDILQTVKDWGREEEEGT